MKQKLTGLKRKTNPQLLVEDFYIPLSAIQRKSKPKISNNRENLNNAINHCGLIYRTLLMMTADYTFFSSANGMFPE